MTIMKYYWKKKPRTYYRTGIHNTLNGAIIHAKNAKKHGKKYIIRKIWNANRVSYEVWTTKNQYEMA